MVKIKICGIRRIEDIEYLNILKPDYAGFVFAKSKRQVNIETAKALIEKLDKKIKTVGVFVNEDRNDVLNKANRLNLDVLQFHGDETPEYTDNFKGFIVWKAIRVKDIRDLELIKQYSVDGILLDSKIEGSFGGTGIPFDWNILNNVRMDKQLILAGGLNSDNILKAIEIVKPDIVDISSSVETEGYKDYKKMKEFIEKVREIS
ncbi:phosphoribosylanthranilate isomerase [Aceticella autotrophica]|uniref:N-(5'-phosphoribosyl)anthranilate isomerase n=1 Tax=Aceticella autotrophica TaxID=2755338 RepID=A0A975AXK6_9THEO|nr:phosphoribosylanthranilate isomerase [Aceticella autotrophica]QSZ28218.1 phosphoribosylanthranilate isomerase [Aceticella autotrophica]